MQNPEKYDYIITGAGCAGLSLLIHLVASGAVAHKKILLIDSSEKKLNDRTWCFWEQEAGLFESIVYKRWDKLWFYSNEIEKELDIRPYSYKLIRGIDFYQYCFEQIKHHPQITYKQAIVKSIISTVNETSVQTDDGKFLCDYIFNSIIFQQPSLSSKEYWLLQHFKGWLIHAEENCFQPSAATLMDFRTDQSHGATFFYVLPFTEKKALIEYTIFSGNLLKEEEYENALSNYIAARLNISSYKVLEQEFGVIPMTNHSFPLKQHNIIYVGTAGGQTKASSGYTFRFIQKQSAAITKALCNNLHPATYLSANKRFSFYDSVLLNILHHRTMCGDKIFSRLFERNRADKVLKFLDNETSITEELGIIKTLPTRVFLKAAIQQVKA